MKKTFTPGFRQLMRVTGNLALSFSFLLFLTINTKAAGRNFVERWQTSQTEFPATHAWAAPLLAVAGEEVRINFQPSSAAVPSGYKADTGLPYDAGRGYGWIDPVTKAPANLSANTRIRSGSDPIYLRTLVQMQDNTKGQVPGNWEYAVANGTYKVTVSAGDPSYYDSKHQVNVEGVTAISGFVPASSAKYKAATVEVQVQDGKLTIDAAGGTNTKLNYISITSQAEEPEVPPTTGKEELVNFQTSASATPTGYKADTGLPYDAARGYGWIDPTTKAPANLTANMRLRNGTDPLQLRTLVQMQDNTKGQVPGNWEYAVLNGTYRVTVSAGDPSYYDSRHQVNVEGVPAISAFVPTARAKYKSGTVDVQVKDGKLTVDATGGTNTKLNYISITPVTTEADVTPPVVTAAVSGSLQSPGVYNNEAQVAISATDESGSGVAKIEYSVNNGTYLAYTSPVKFTQVGSYNVKARATDVAGNQAVKETGFSVATPTKSNAYLVLQNMDGFLASDVLTFSNIQIPWRRTNDDGTFTPYNANHNKVRLRLYNKGTGTLMVNNLTLSDATLFKIEQLNGVAYDPATAKPFSISSKGYAELVIEFIAKDQATRVKVVPATLRISSNDDLVPEKEVKLYGLWQLKGEGNSEPWAKEIISAFGFKTKVNFNSNDGSYDGKSIIPNSDEVDVSYFVRVDPSKPVRVVQMAAYHGCCSSRETLQRFDKATGAVTSVVTHTALDGQSLLPRKNGSTTAIAEGSFTPTGAFGFKVTSNYTDRTKNPGGKLGGRVWKAIDANGNIIPNAYILGMDYLGTSYTNYDYQDNIYYISNVKPDAGPAYYSELAATPSAVTFNLQTVGANQSITVPVKNMGQSYANGSDPAVQVKSVELVGPNASEFSVGAFSATTLPVQGTLNLNVSFNPTSRGLKNAALLVHYNSSGSPLRVPLYGIANESGSSTNIVKRIKGAADANVTIAGKVWEADASYRKGSIKLDKQAVTTPIAATDEDALYQTYLSASANLAETRYDIPLANGSYMVRMHFVENYFTASGARVVGITAENVRRISNLDIFSEVGYRTALVKDIEVNVTDGVLNFKFNPTENRVAIAGLEIYRSTAGSALASQENTQALTAGMESGKMVQVFPNPVSGSTVGLALQGFGAQENITIQVYDLSGRLVKSENVNADSQGSYNSQISLSNKLRSGLYIIKASAASGNARTKLILE